MATERLMDITLINSKDWQFKIKGRIGTLFTLDNAVRIESSKDGSSKDLFGPGEYEVAGISVIGIKNNESTVFVYEVDNLRICHFGKQLDVLAEGKLTQVGDIDVLLLPIGPKSIEMMQQIEGYYVIPYGYSSEEELEKFLKESGISVKRLPKFSLKKEEIMEEQLTEIVVLESK